MAASNFDTTLYGPAGGTANATVSSQLQTNFASEDVCAAYCAHVVDTKHRWVGVALLDQVDTNKYRLYKHERADTPGTAETTVTTADYSTLAGACDAASTFLDTASDT